MAYMDRKTAEKEFNITGVDGFLISAQHPVSPEVAARLRDLATEGLDDGILDAMTEALLRMKLTLTQEAHPTRRFSPVDAEAREVA